MDNPENIKDSAALLSETNTVSPCKSVDVHARTMFKKKSRHSSDDDDSNARVDEDD